MSTQGINKTKYHDMPIREPFLSLIRKEEKRVEGRVNSIMCRRLRTGDFIHFFNRCYGILCKITFLHDYSSFEQMLKREGVSNLLPGIHSIREGIRVYENFPGANREKRCGVVAIGIRVIDDNYSKE